MKEYILNLLHTDVDVFNINLQGTFIESTTGKNVLSLYQGKSIIMCANAFQYFQSGQREIWQLLDASEVARLARMSTSFVFLDVTDSAALRDWWEMPPNDVLNKTECFRCSCQGFGETHSWSKSGHTH